MRCPLVIADCLASRNRPGAPAGVSPDIPAVRGLSKVAKTSASNPVEATEKQTITISVRMIIRIPFPGTIDGSPERNVACWTVP